MSPLLQVPHIQPQAKLPAGKQPHVGSRHVQGKDTLRAFYGSTELKLCYDHDPKRQIPQR